MGIDKKKLMSFPKILFDSYCINGINFNCSNNKLQKRWSRQTSVETNYNYYHDNLSCSNEELTYGELLRAIRIGHVTEINWLTNPTGHPFQPEGPCLVTFKEGFVKQSYVPFTYNRLWFALENHGVKAGKINVSWCENEGEKFVISPKLSQFISLTAPLLGI